jgi:DNA-binding winged helix-turn-helix (wHTH) protein
LNRARSLHVVESSGVERWIDLDRGVTTIGRDPRCNLRLDSPYISRQHARIDVGETGPVLTDLGSRNGSLVNGVAATGNVHLLAGDVINMGDVTITCTAESAHGTPTLVPFVVTPIRQDLLRVDSEVYEVWIGERRLHRRLSAQEFQLLRYLYANRDRVCTRQELGDSVWGQHNWDQNMLHRLAHRLKNKLEPRRGQQRYAQTVPWVGYRLTP